MTYFPCFDCAIWDIPAARDFLCSKCCANGDFDRKKREGEMRELENHIAELENRIAELEERIEKPNKQPIE